MDWTGNTIFITGGGSGIGRGLAEALHRKGNQIIISGRRASRLAEVTAANPGMRSIELDIESRRSISAAAKQLNSNHPALNVLINNAGIMRFDDISAAVDDDLLISTLTTNLMGPIRMTSALIGQLKQQPHAAIINASSVLGFIPLAVTAIYSATKAAMHSYTLSLRYQLRDTSIKVIELPPPWVQTDLLNSNNEPRAMPLPTFIAEAMAILESGADEIVVRHAAPIRGAAGLGDSKFMFKLNDQVASGAAVV
jgi:uncharacterized oxidoreductase